MYYIIIIIIRPSLFIHVYTYNVYYINGLVGTNFVLLQNIKKKKKQPTRSKISVNKRFLGDGRKKLNAYNTTYTRVVYYVHLHTSEHNILLLYGV